VTSARFIVVMGVSGSGKTTLARGLADRLGWAFLEGDDLHPQANITKMSAGLPLTDEDRQPWLDRLGAWLDERAAEGVRAVVTCSALKRRYRDALVAGRPGLTFCHVQADPALIARRVRERRGHYMPSSLLPSQLQALEQLAADEPGVVVSADGEPAEVLADAVARLGLAVA
jgi:gluconokinase